MTAQQPTETSMIVTPRQEYLQRVRDEMSPGEQPAAIVPRTFAEVMTMCQALAQAAIAPKHLRGNPVEMAMVVMTGLEVGLPPMASLRLYTTWDGVPRLMAEGVRAVILTRATTIEYFEMATCSDTEATWIGKRRGRPEKSVTWTIERAKKAGLLSKDTWQKYPQDLLNARASMQLGRIIAPDIVAGMVALEEARDGDFLDAQGVEAKPVFVAPPAPERVIVVGSPAWETAKGPPPSVPQVAVIRDTPQGPQAVTVTDTGTKPSEPARRGPGRPPGRPPLPKDQTSQTPGTDPFRAAREAVDAREAERPTAPASAPMPSPQPSASTSAPATGSNLEVAPAASSPTTDRWGQTVGEQNLAKEIEVVRAAQDAGMSKSDLEQLVRSAADDGFGGEDPQDSQPAPTGDPGLELIAELKAFMAGCRTQTEMQNGRPPFARRSVELCTSGDRRYDNTPGKPVGELADLLGKLWAARKAELPL